MDWLKILGIASSVYGILTAVVKFCPTISAKFPWLLEIIKFLGNITNRQTDDAAVRTAQGK